MASILDEYASKGMGLIELQNSSYLFGVSS